MHGLILSEFKRFVVQTRGAEVWNALQAARGGGPLLFLPRESYPDEQAVALVVGLAEATGTPVRTVLEEFGTFLVPPLLRAYGVLVNPAWRSLDVLENTEAAIHRVVRLRVPEAAPPEIRAQRMSPDQVRIEYRSPRRLCSLARGIAKGVGDHFGERLRIEEPGCRDRGDPACVFLVSRER